MAQVSHFQTEMLSPDSKPINPFSIEHILKSQPPSPPYSTDEVTNNSESNLPSNQLLINPQVAWVLYQTQLQNYWRCLLIHNLTEQGKAKGKLATPVKPVILPGAFVSAQNVGNKTGNTIFKIQTPITGTKRNAVITPSTEKKMKLDVYIKEHSQQDKPILTPEEYKLKCSKALPILHEDLISNENSLKTFLAMIDINKVLDLSVTDLNVIIDNATFSDEERAYIRELRRKAMNKKAAEECRRRKKSEEQHLSEEFENLRNIRRRLFSEKERISIDISTFKKTIGELPPEAEDDALTSPANIHEPIDTALNTLN
ncbi:hypothetical protein LOD99_6 [Oopsacas minuta]|uniref:BZIP domain-containing protein n=1 Tax=Oopsacas minuta TaxID=111878 RepID=A0AAV7KAF4_9METZ|nr:hypothetical protein LOD99_6 [Oopsacas minuta]